MIQLKDVSYRYTSAKADCLKGINLSIQKGECVVITGSSGSGKTTLTRVLNGLCPKFYGGALKGNYSINNEDVKTKKLDEIGAVLGSVFQDPRSQFFAKNVRDEIVLGMENHCYDRSLMKTRVEKVSKMLGIEHLLKRQMVHLSSGEKQKVAIASVCVLSPAGYVLDEPSSNLDLDATTALLDFLKYAKSLGSTIIVSEHRLYYLKDIVDRIIIMENGEIKKQWTKDEFLNQTDASIADLGLRCMELPKLEVGLQYNNNNDNVQLKEISLFKNPRTVLNRANFSNCKGQITVVVGKNGAGKSSLIKILTGAVKESNGLVLIDDMYIKRRNRFSKTFLVAQDVDYQLYESTLFEEFLISNKSITKQEVDMALKEVGLNCSLDINPHTLSGGQKQRLLIALAKATKRNVMVLDEPTSGLDGDNMKKIAKLLIKQAQSGKNIIVVTHDLELISLIADNICYLKNGEVIYQRAIKQ